MIGLKLISLVYILAVVNGQEYQDYPQSSRQAPLRLSNSGNSNLNTAPTPVPILKQINKHNEDGSYTYGYEGADGSFKIETKLATGEVKGKYGYVDETGKVRVVEYGANKYGFQPSGEGITVAPPTLVDETTNKDRLQADYDDEQPQQQQQQRYVPRPQPRPQQSRPQYSAPPPPPPQRHQPQQQYNDYDDQPQQQPQQQQQPKYTSAPVPARAQISGAVPIDVVYSSRPRPARPDPEYVQKQTFSAGPLSQAPIRFSNPQPVQQQSFAPAPQPAYSAPRPQQQQQQQQQQQPQYQQQPSGRSPSVLDQLAKDFALPQGGSPALHDISFGYY